MISEVLKPTVGPSVMRTTSPVNDSKRRRISDHRAAFSLAHPAFPVTTLTRKKLILDDATRRPSYPSCGRLGRGPSSTG
jgi:hypothetical protein